MDRFHHKFYGAVTLGERGQIVIPQEARDEMGLKPGEKLLVFRHGPSGAGLFIMRAEDVSGFVSDAMRRLSQLSEAISTAGNAGPQEAPAPEEGGENGGDGDRQ